MYAIKKIRDKGYNLKAKNNKLIFENKIGNYIIFELESKTVFSDVIDVSNCKEYNNLISQMERELGWLDE